ncbi:MAG: glutamine-hydrolyzing carbamoyl-phosphate synthase small subunit [Thermoleophilia bacterium]|nr:glutamine-hydrolyzing carbamoyl-phosphate synthase small subunit [Thermoleophilia bacterium]
MQTTRPAQLVLEDGTVFPGRAAGAPGVAAGEICFTTAMAGYEEAVTDPSYSAQVLTFSYPLVGNYGVDEGRMESDRIWTRAVVARRLRPAFAGWLAGRGVVALEEVDTRAVVRHVRSQGAMRCALGEAEPGELLARALAEPHIDYERALAEPELAHPPLGLLAGTREPYSEGSGPRVAVLDFGCKRSIVRRLAERGLEAYVCPPTFAADVVLELRPRAVLVGNGPGDPAQLTEAIRTVRDLLGRVELFGVCLGHQLLGLALGLGTYKLPFGHRGANHPVRVRDTSRVLVTVQNHGFAVGASDAPEVSHLSLNDGTVEGLAGDGFASLQFHPEAAPGPLDAIPFFDRIADACRSAPTFAAS